MQRVCTLKQHWDTVAIVGVGLIGGSVGLALQKRGLVRRVVGIGHRAATLRKAKQRGAVTSTTTKIARGVADAELVVVCTPVGSIVGHVREVAESCPAGALITDVGSTKARIVSQLDGQLGAGDSRDVRFVGSHPLAGSEKTGPQNAREDLFQGRVVVVTPSRRSRSEDVASIERFWEVLGARVMRRTPQAHDEAVAAISHLPHVVAAALAAATPAKHLPLAAAGWLDTTRVAAGDADLWWQILRDNRQQVLKSLEQFTQTLASFREALQREDQGKIIRLFEAGKRNRDSVGS